MPPLSVNNLSQIAAAGGGFDIIAGNYQVKELTLIAQAAGQHQARLRILQCEALSLQELTQIAAAGKGAVWFEI